MASGPPLTTPGGHCHFLGGAVDGDPRAAVAEHAERGVDVVKVMASGGFATPETDQLGAQFTVAELTALVERGARAGLPVVAHAHSLVGHAERPGGRRGRHRALHRPLRRGRRRSTTTCWTRSPAAACTWTSTMGNDRSLHALMPAPPPPIAELMARLGVGSFDEFYASRIGMFSAAAEHGVAVIAGVDSGMGPTKRHGNAWRTVAEQVDGGYYVPEALAERDVAGGPGVRARRGEPADSRRGTTPTCSSWPAISPGMSRC